MTAIPYQSHSETSMAAASSMTEDAKNLKTKVLNFIISTGPTGATDEEIQSALGMNPNTERPRRIDLVSEGFVVDSGEQRITKSNRKAVVWVDAELMPGKASITGWHRPLEEYYVTDHWTGFRDDYFQRYPKVCFVTGRTDNIDLHHIRYTNLNCEKDEDVVPLCRDMHERLHRLVKEYKVPLETAHLVLKETMGKERLVGSEIEELKGYLKNQSAGEARNSLLQFVSQKMLLKDLLNFFRGLV